MNREYFDRLVSQQPVGTHMIFGYDLWHKVEPGWWKFAKNETKVTDRDVGRAYHQMCLNGDALRVCFL